VKLYGEGPYMPLQAYKQDKETGSSELGRSPLAKGIDAGATKCPVPIGLLSPDFLVQGMCSSHNKNMGRSNRSGIRFCPVTQDFDQVASGSEVLGYYALHNAPSTLWLPFLESKGITDWSDALPGTRLPDRQVLSHN